jgi:hypothetical protein
MQNKLRLLKPNTLTQKDMEVNIMVWNSGWRDWDRHRGWDWAGCGGWGCDGWGPRRWGWSRHRVNCWWD